MNRKRYVKGVVIGGLLGGFLSILPLIQVCCFIWIPIGAALAVYIAGKDNDDGLSAGEGALTGLYAGLVAFLVVGAIQTSITYLTWDSYVEQVKQMSDMFGTEFPPQLERKELIIPMTLFIQLLSSLLLGLVGGLLGTAFAGRRERTPESPPPPPPVQ